MYIYILYIYVYIVYIYIYIYIHTSALLSISIDKCYAHGDAQIVRMPAQCAQHFTKAGHLGKALCLPWHWRWRRHWYCHLEAKWAHEAPRSC